MAKTTVYTIPQACKDYVRKQGYPVAIEPMESYIEEWYSWLKAEGDFYDYKSKDSAGRVYQVHRLSMHPAQRVCNEWASLILNEDTVINCEQQECTDWLADFFGRKSFFALGQGLIARAFALGTGAWAVWLNVDAGVMQVRRYDARMVLPLSWDDDGVSECAFVTQVSHEGKALDQVQMHVMEGGMYHIKTAIFDDAGKQVSVEGVEEDFDTRCPTPTFAVVRPAIDNTCVDLSPYGQSVYADAIDAIKACDLSYDAIFSEVDLSKMRIFLSDMMFEVEDRDGKPTAIPFGKDDCTVYRRVQSTEDMIQIFAPQMRTETQKAALRTSLQSLGDLCGFGSQYFDVDKSGGLKTATEVSSDNSMLMRNVKKHENLLEGAIAQLGHAVLHCAREFLGVPLPEEGEITVQWDDSIITDTATEKAQDLAEVNVTMQPWEYRVKWYGEDEATAKANVPGQRVTASPFDFQDETSEELPEDAPEE